MDKFMNNIIQEREGQLLCLEREWKKVEVTNPLLWK